LKVLVLILGVSLVLGGCAGKDEQLAKCSADDSPVPALGYGPEPPKPPAFDTVLPPDCGPMRPVNHF
jgi:hypothetical protein